MTDAVKKRLLDALWACQAVQRFTGDVDFAFYDHDLLLRSAVERQLEIVGEALAQARRDDATVVERIPSLPRVVGLRNRIIHSYDSVDNEIMWDVVQVHVPLLVKQLQSALDDVYE